MATALAAVLAPFDAAAQIRRDRTAPVSSVPLAVDPSPPFAQIWLDGQLFVDAEPVAMTMSDGRRWRSGVTSRWELAGGLTLGPFAGALLAGPSVIGVALQTDVVRRSSWKVGATASGRLVYGGGYDLSFTPVVAARRPLGARTTIVPFGAARFRWGITDYEVQGWDSDRSSPFASAETRDLALAPMAGVAVTRGALELRLTAGWDFLLVDRVIWEERPTGFSRSGGPFAAIALRLLIGGNR